MHRGRLRLAAGGRGCLPTGSLLEEAIQFGPQGIKGAGCTTAGTGGTRPRTAATPSRSATSSQAPMALARHHRTMW